MNKLCIISLIFISFLDTGCIHSKPENSSVQNQRTDNDIAKIVKYKLYTAKPKFDEFVIDSPVQNMMYVTNIFRSEFSFWETEYYDRYGNMVIKEKLEFDKNGAEKVTLTSYFNYSNPESHILSSIIEEYNDDYNSNTVENKYLRDEEGVLIEIQSRSDNNLSRKEIYTYNTIGQIIRKEIYYEEGIDKWYEYEYNVPEDGIGKVIKETYFIAGEKSYRRETKYYYSKDGNLDKEWIRTFDRGRIFSEFNIFYKNYVNGIATTVIDSGFQGHYESKNLEDPGTFVKGDPVKLTVTKIVNSNNDIVSYQKDYQRFDNSGNKIENHMFDNSGNKIIFIPSGNRSDKFEYTYNEQGDWVKCIVYDQGPGANIVFNEQGGWDKSIVSNNMYLIFKEIEYFKN